MAEGSELPVGVAVDSSQFPEETEAPEVSVDVAKDSVQVPGATENSEVLVGVTVNHTQLPVVGVGPERTEVSGTFEKEHRLEGVPGVTRGCARHRHPLVAARCPRARAAASPEKPARCP